MCVCKYVYVNIYIFIYLFTYLFKYHGAIMCLYINI